MTTSLGHHASSQMRIGVRNSSTTVTIDPFTVVKFDFANGIDVAEGMDNDPLVNVLKNDIPDGTTGAAAIAMGISQDTIGPGENGEIVIWGLTKAVIEDTGLSIGDVLGIQATADHNLHDIGTAAEQAPCAVLLEATTATTQTKWVMADFISGSFGGDAGTNALSVKFWGITY